MYHLILKEREPERAKLHVEGLGGTRVRIAIGDYGRPVEHSINALVKLCSRRCGG